MMMARRLLLKKRFLMIYSWISCLYAGGISFCPSYWTLSFSVFFHSSSSSYSALCVYTQESGIHARGEIGTEANSDLHGVGVGVGVGVCVRQRGSNGHHHPRSRLDRSIGRNQSDYDTLHPLHTPQHRRHTHPLHTPQHRRHTHPHLQKYTSNKCQNS